MNGFDARLLSIEQAGDIYLHNKKYSDNKIVEGSNIESFQDILIKKANETGDVRFSKHANQRLLSRNIVLSDEQINRLNNGVNRARDKSIKESLIMMDNLAFIVNVKNNTVVTALSKEDDSVFTNIDGAVIV
mgnify:FL=1